MGAYCTARFEISDIINCMALTILIANTTKKNAKEKCENTKDFKVENIL